MRSKTKRILFTLFAPITLPAYALFLAFSNLLGGAFYIVIEASLSPMLRRPIALTRTQMALLAVPVLLVSPIAMAVLMARWLVRLLLAWIAWIGRWQAGATSRWSSLLFGGAWLIVALWTTVTCMNAAVGAGWIGRPVEGREIYLDGIQRSRSLSELPAEVQDRRREIIAALSTRQEKVHPQWEYILRFLEDDTNLFRWLRNDALWRKMVGMPWYFEPAEFSKDGLDHSDLLLGPLIFVWMLLIRWPGLFRVLPNPPARVLGLLVRLGLAAGAIHYLVTWDPLTLYYGFWFEPEEMSRLFAALCPAHWLGLNYIKWVRPEWYLFNAGLWMILIALLSFGWTAAWRVAPLLGWPKYYVAFLASRLLQRKRIAFFSVGAVTLCVAMMIIVISVMGGFVDSIRTRAHGLLGDLIVDNASMQGFPYYQEFIDRIQRLTDQEGRPIVVQATPIVHTFGLIQFPVTKRTKAVSIRGIRLDEYVKVNKFGDDLFYEQRYGGTRLGPQQQPVYSFNEQGIAVLPEEMEKRYQQYLESLSPSEREEEARSYYREPGDLYPGPGIFKGPEEKPGYIGREYPGIILGRSILFRRLPSGEYQRGEAYPRGELCILTVLPMTRGGDISPEAPPKPSFRYIDDSRTGIHEIDSMNVYVDFEVLQRLLSMEPMERADGSGMAAARCNQILIKVRPDLESRRALAAQKQLLSEEWEKLIDELPADPFEHSMLRQVDIQTWEEMQASYISAIEKEKFLVLIMFGVISIVAIFLILCIFYMIVQEKTRDIGIIKSVGGSAEGVAAVFLAYGGAIGLVGCILGALLGTTFVEHINDIQEWLAKLNPEWRVWSPETYSFDKIPDVWKWSEVLWISVLSILASIVGAAFPALRAGRTWPVETLRYE